MDRSGERPKVAAIRARWRRDVDYLIAALSDRDAGARDTAARSLGLLGDPRAVAPLIRRLRAKDDGHRVLVIQALRKLSDPSAATDLYEIATDERVFGQVRMIAASALGACNDRRGIDVLAEVAIEPETIYSNPLHGSSRRAGKKWAGRWLVKLDGHEAIPRLEEAIQGHLGHWERRRLRRLVRRLSRVRH
jgi:hypothetical protein